MSLIDYDSWVTESEAVERTLFEIQTQIGQLQSGNQDLSHSRTELTSRVRARLAQVNGDLQTLVRKLDGGKSSSITRDELERRQRNLEKLQTQHFHLNKDFNSVAGQTTITSSIIRRMPSSSLWEDLDGGGGPSSSSTSSARNSNANSNAAVAAGSSITATRDQIIRQQNEGLENLSKILSRNKSIALKIHSEVEEQDAILDDIAVQMDNTDGRINNGTQAIEDFSRKDSSTALWLIILGLFIAIVIVWLI